MQKLLLNLKTFAGKNWQTIALVIAVILLIFSYAGCGNNKGDNKDLQAELDKCKSMYVACDTAHIELTRINSEQAAKLRDIEIPDPLVVENNEVQILKEQIKRNKLKQVELIGERVADSIAFENAIKLRDFEIDIVYNLAQLKADSITLLLNQLTAANKKRVYQDSIIEDEYTANYIVNTTGTLDGFKLAVDAKPVIITRTINTPAPPAQQYRYKNNIKLTYSPASTWDTKYDITQKAGIEYERSGALGFRANANYLIDTKDYEAQATIYLRPFQWGKKIK